MVVLKRRRGSDEGRRDGRRKKKTMGILGISHLSWVIKGKKVI